MENGQRESQLLALLSEKQGALRKKSEQMWNRQGEVRVSASEWYILSKVQGRQVSAPEIARAADITRQAAHKYIHGLMDKGLLQSSERGQQRGKRLELSCLGQECWHSYIQMQSSLESQIANHLGDDGMEKLKRYLESDWFTIEN